MGAILELRGGGGGECKCRTVFLGVHVCVKRSLHRSSPRLLTISLVVRLLGTSMKCGASPTRGCDQILDHYQVGAMSVVTFEADYAQLYDCTFVYLTDMHSSSPR